MMMRNRIYWFLLLLGLGLVACNDNDNIGEVGTLGLIRYDFPQGNDPWDLEIEQIAKDWGMYIIYKGVDSTALNQKWTTSGLRSPRFVCNTPSAEEIQVYLKLVKESLLSTMDQNSREDREQLPLYLYLVNDFRDNNPLSQTYGRHYQLKKDGFDYWCLSMSSEELAQEMTPEAMHLIACSFSYPGVKARFTSGEYKIAPDFLGMSDYETRIGIRNVSMEQFRKDNPGKSESWYNNMYPNKISNCERDPENVYYRRGFIRQVSETDFKAMDYFIQSSGLALPIYGAPLWMPWVKTRIELGGGRVFETEYHPATKTIPVAEDRPMEDFLNTIRVAMTYTEKQIREMYPLDAEDPLDRIGYEIINRKYDIVVKYMMENYHLDLPKYAAILGNE